MSVTFEPVRHPALGALYVMALSGADGTGRARMNPREAMTLSRALAAVRAGTSTEREIYISPIASDHDVVALVGVDGVVLDIGPARVGLAWPAVGDVSNRLADWAEKNAA